MRARNVLFILLLTVIVLAVCLWLNRLPQSQKQPIVTRSEAVPTDSRSRAENAKPGETPDRHETPVSVETSASIPTYQMNRVRIAPDPKEEAKSQTPQAFKLVGGGSSTAKIVDLEGKAVLESAPYNTIASCSVSPEGGRILVYHGNSDYEVFNPTTNSRATLPQQPPGEKKLAFSAWDWIDEDSLLGQSGDELANRKDVAGEDRMEIQGRLYLYSISRQQLAEVQLPKDLGTRVFSVIQVSPNGYIHLVNEDPNATGPPDLGWFEVQTPQ
jgi:hypothetical protein